MVDAAHQRGRGSAGARSGRGAGGAPIAYLDPNGAFRVGPRSASTFSGTACYGRGGREPAVTDAQVVLGRLDPEYFLGGDLKIDSALAHAAIETHVVTPLILSVKDAAPGMLKVFNNDMARAINGGSVAKGVDPRNSAPLGFGSAGLLHATSLAEIIGAKDIISPLNPGCTAAMDLLLTELRYEYNRLVLVLAQEAGASRVRRSQPNRR